MQIHFAWVYNYAMLLLSTKTTAMQNTSSQIEKVDFSDALSERYLAYALSTIMSRSLPDVRDGLKPVHRRLLYAMLQLNLAPDSAYKKCARVVGDVIGKYHPHGDVAVYETLVRLAQNFSLRYPLIDGQGNFGSIDGDGPAAMRYTESRLTSIALELMGDLNKDTVDFRLTYDDSDNEPVIFPAAFPNLLANGSEGIAVGMATSIPPHNLDELCDATLYLVDHPSAEVVKLLDFIQGPDFPTGGIMEASKEAILQIYETGRGAVKLQARWERENLSHGTYQIVITEIPYQVQKSKLIEQIADLLRDKKLPLIDSIRDESAEDIRVIIEPKNRSCSPEMIMQSLFKQTPLEFRVNVNMNVISSRGIPIVMNLKQILEEFIAHRKDIITRRSQFILGKIIHRLEILEGFRIAYLNLDEVIKIIREEDEPKAIMMKRFGLSDIQAEAILNMRLRSLRRLEEIEIQREFDRLSLEKAELEGILSDENKLKKVLKNELKDIQKRFSKDTIIGKRKTDLVEASGAVQEIHIEAFIEREPITVICSKMGWIRSQKGHLIDLSGLKYKEGDEEGRILHCQTTDNLLIFTSCGRFYTILADNIYKGKGDGEPIKMMVSIENDDEIIAMHVYKPGMKFLVASTSGKGFIVDAGDTTAQTKMGKQILNIVSGEKALACLAVKGDKVATVGTNRKLLVFDLTEIPEMKRGQGVMLQRFKDGRLSDIQMFESAQGMKWTASNGKIRIEQDLLPWQGKRAAAGKIPPTGFGKDNRFF